jgi:ATP-binding cassette subfamily F protein 3
MIVWQRPNLPLLDEPTNHLDLATREALAMALNEFEGTVMLVSHDRALLRSVCDSFWLVTRGGVSDFDGDLDDYQQFLLDEAKRQREEAAAPKVSAAQAAPKAKPASNRQKGLQRDLDKLDQHIQRLQKNKSAQEAALSGTTDASAIAEAGRKLQAIQEELDALEVRWLALAEDIEACKA